MSKEPSPPHQIPEYIGKYHIDGVFAQGGMSTLYLASDPDTHDQIIIKVLLPRFLHDPAMVEQFITEGRIIAMTDHPNIVRLYEYGEWEGGLFIAMELVQGISLRKMLQHNPLPLKKALEVLLQVCYAIGHLHAHGVVHGDLKPENILVTDLNQVKIIDFGIAKVLSAPSDSKTKRFAGTPIYMSPEARENPKACSVQSDIYSIGIISYELVMGRITHGRVILTLAPKGLQSILQKALQPEAKDRYKDINELIQAISEYIHSGEVQKDRQGADYFFELFEQVEAEQKALLSSLISTAPPTVGVTLSYGVGLNALYIQSLQIAKTTITVIAEGIHKGIRGIIDTFRLHTIFEATKNQHLDISSFFSSIVQEAARQGLSFRYSALILHHDTHTYSWTREGWGLLYITYDSTTQLLPFPGEESHHIEGKFEKGYRFTIVGCTSPTILQFSSSPVAPIEVALTEAIQASRNLSPEKQTNSILQKLRLRGDCVVDDHPVCLISIST